MIRVFLLHDARKPALVALAKALTSKEVRKFILNSYGGAVVPAFQPSRQKEGVPNAGHPPFRLAGLFRDANKKTAGSTGGGYV